MSQNLSASWNFRQSLLAGGVFAAVLAIGLSFGVAPARAFNPDSPEVQKLIERGLGYLATTNEPRLGGKCLIAMAFHKHLGDANHPKVVEAVQACKAVAKPDPKDVPWDMYSIGIAIIFLCDLDPYLYREEIRRLHAGMMIKQRANGGFGYPAGGGPHGETGDTSMTQYAVLCTWTAMRTNAITLPKEEVEKVAQWLILTQDPSGGWGYQGNVSPNLGKRVEQSDVRLSLSTAGIGSTYVCAEMLGLMQMLEVDEHRLEGLPPAVRLAREDKKVEAKTKIDKKFFDDAIRGGNAWMSRNYKMPTESWNHYYMYALERYQSFKELADGKSEKEPKWYNDGVKHLRDTIDKEKGFWKSNAGEAVDTAFGVLFLMRSTKKLIQKTIELAAEGTLVGGRGLPKDTRNVRLKGGQLVGRPATMTIDSLLTALEDPSDESAQDDLIASLDELKLSADPEERRKQMERMKQLLSSRSIGARRVAVRMLVEYRDFDNAPLLIAAITDPNPFLAREAHLGLRSLSRKFVGFDWPANGDPDARKQLAEKWQAWYRGVRSDSAAR